MKLRKLEPHEDRVYVSFGAAFKELRIPAVVVVGQEAPPPILTLLVSGTKLDRAKDKTPDGQELLGDKVMPEMLAVMREQAAAGGVYLIENHSATIPMGWSCAAWIDVLPDGNQELRVDFELDMSQPMTQGLVKLFRTRPDYQPQCSVGMQILRVIAWDADEGGYVGRITEGHFEHVALTRPDHAAYSDAEIEEFFMSDSLAGAAKELVLSTVNKTIATSAAGRKEKDEMKIKVAVAKGDDAEDGKIRVAKSAEQLDAEKVAKEAAEKEAAEKEAAEKAAKEAAEKEAAEKAAKEANEKRPDATTKNEDRPDACGKEANEARPDASGKEAAAPTGAESGGADSPVKNPPPGSEAKNPPPSAEPDADDKSKQSASEYVAAVCKLLDSSQNASPDEIKEMMGAMRADMGKLAEALGGGKDPSAQPDPGPGGGSGREGNGDVAKTTKDDMEASTKKKDDMEKSEKSLADAGKPPAAKSLAREAEEAVEALLAKLLPGITQSITKELGAGFGERLTSIEKTLEHVSKIPASTSMPLRFNGSEESSGAPKDATAFVHKALEGVTDPSIRATVTKNLAESVLSRRFEGLLGGGGPK